MSEEVKYYCDMCGREEKKNALSKIQINFWRHPNSEVCRLPLNPADICYECLEPFLIKRQDNGVKGIFEWFLHEILPKIKKD